MCPFNNLFNDRDIFKSLGNTFANILIKHWNSKWAFDELCYIVYYKYRYMYDSLSEFHRSSVDGYMMALELLHGGR